METLEPRRLMSSSPAPTGFRHGPEGPAASAHVVGPALIDPAARTAPLASTASTVLDPMLGAARQLSEVPAIGIHPRVLFSPSDLADIRDRIENTTVGGILGAQTDNWFNGSPSITLQTLADLDLSSPTLAQVNAHWTNNEGRNIAFLLGALDAVLEDSAPLKQVMIDAVTNYGRLVNASQQLLPTHSDWSRNAWNLGVAGRAGGTGFALAYDLLHNDMTTAQRDIVRSAIANATAGRRSWGMEFEPGRAYSNWYMYNLNLVPMVLAIEGEDGYDAQVYDLAVQAAQDYFDHSVYPSGANFEDMYSTLALREGSEAMMAMARRGDNFFEHPHYRAMLKWASQSLNPFPTTANDGGGFVGHASGGGQSFPNFWVAAKHMYPDSPVVDYAWDHYNDDNYWALTRYSQTYHFATLFATDVDPGAAERFADTGLGLTEFYDRRGLLITRSDASTDAAYLHLDARPDAFLPGHDNADRGSFTYAALGRSWVADDEWGTFQASTDHSLVHIDGVAQAYKAPSVKFLDHHDDGTFVTAATDLEYAYDWQWAPPWPSANTVLPAPWEKELSDPRDLGWPVDDGYLPDSLWGHADFGFNGLYNWRAPYNDVERAYRSTALARGEDPYVLIVDDVRKDDFTHDYQWYMHLEDDLVLESVNGHDIVLSSPGDDRRLLVRFLEAQGMGATAQAQVETYTRPDRHGNPVAAKRLIVTTHTVEPKFKVMLYAHRAGDALPTTTWNAGGDALGIVIGDQADTAQFTVDADGRTITTLTRDDGTVQPVTVAGRQTFYHDSAYDNQGAATAASVANGVANAIAPDVQALRPGQQATAAHYSNYTKGINGIIVDLQDLNDPTAVDLADFTFTYGNDNDPTGWVDAPTPTLTLLEDAGVGGSDRFTFTWEDNAVAGQWIQVTTRATATTGLAADDVFYLGSAPGEVTGNAAVSTADVIRIRRNRTRPGQLIDLLNPHDINRDGKVSNADVILARRSLTNPRTRLSFIHPPAN